MLENVQIKVMKNGPLVIKGKAEITDENWDINETEGKMVALCPYGQSATKPFCDGSHKKAVLWVNEAYNSFYQRRFLRDFRSSQIN